MVDILMLPILWYDNGLQEVDIPTRNFLDLILHRLYVDLIQLMDLSQETVLQDLERDFPVVVLDDIVYVLL